MVDFDQIKENATFIVGHPRSGTTLLRGLLDFHPELIVYPFEMHFFNYNKMMKNIFATAKLARLGQVHGSLDIDLEDIRDKVNGCQFPEKRLLLEIIRYFYVSIDLSEKNENKRWVEKTPINIHHIPLLNKWFGNNIKIIYIYRDPRDIYVSIKKKYPSTTVDDFCKSYIQTHERANFIENFFTTDNFIKIRFEDLLKNSVKTLNNLCTFLSISFNKSLMEQTINGNPSVGNSRFGDNSNTINKNISARHMHYTHQKEIGKIELKLSPLLREVGYNYSDEPLNSVSMSKYTINKYYQRFKFLLKWQFPYLNSPKYKKNV